MSPQKKAAEWWSDPERDVPGTQWLQIPGAVENMNRRATGDPEMDWITHSAALLAKFAKPIKALSLGCGFGVIERVLRRCDYCQLIHGLDVAEGAVRGKESSPGRGARRFDVRSRRSEHRKIAQGDV